MKSLVRSILATPLVTALLLLVWSANPSSAGAWELEVVCENDALSGEIEIPESGTFIVFVQERVSDGDFEEILGAEETLTVASGKEGLFVPFGPIDVSAADDKADMLRVRWRYPDGDVGEEFKDVLPCPEPTPTPTRTATATSTSVPNTPTQTSTPAPATKTVVPTSTKAGGTSSTAVVPTNTPTLVPTSTPVQCRGICLPQTGSGGDEHQPEHYSPGEIAFMAVSTTFVLAVMFVGLGILVYAWIKKQLHS